MKKLCLLLVLFLGCTAMQAPEEVLVEFKLNEGRGETVTIPKSIVDKSTVMSNALELAQEEENHLIKKATDRRETYSGEHIYPVFPSGFAKQDIDNMIIYIQTEELEAKNALLDGMESDTLDNFLSLIDFSLFDDDIIKSLGNYHFDTATINNLSGSAIANDIFKKSLHQLVDTDKKSACELYSKLEEGLLKDLLGELFPLWHLQDLAILTLLFQ